MKHSISTIHGLTIITLSLEDIFREYMSCITDIMWDISMDQIHGGEESDVQNYNFAKGIQALRSGDEKEIQEMFKSGKTTLLIGSMMDVIENLDGLEHFPVKSPKQPYILMITNPRNSSSIIVNGKDVWY